MKLNLRRRITLSCFALMLSITCVAAQSSTPSPSAEQSSRVVETMGEDDRLPFMRDERSNNTTEASSGGMLLRTLGGLMLIVGLIFCGAWGLKKFGPKFGLLPAHTLVRPDAPELAVLHSVGLGNGRTLAVVRFGERNLLVGSTAHSFTLLANENSDETNLGEPTVAQPNRSVADLLAEENTSFADELNAADSRLSIFTRKQV